MRALNKGWIGITLVILFGASLFFFRGSSRYSNLFNSDNFVANVSGTQISTTQFLRSLELNIGQFAQMIGEELTGDQIRAFQIHQLVLQNLVNNAIFENEFDKLNFIVDDTIIAENTKKRFPNLYLNNKINDDALNSFLRQQRLKIDDLVSIIDYETRADVFDNLFFNQNYPDAISKKIDLFNNQIRDIDLLKISFDTILIPDLNKNKISKDNQELKEFFDNNNLNYMSKENRDISYIVINKNSYLDKFMPSENEMINYFDGNKELYTIPEKRSFKQFNFKSKEEAENFKIKIGGLSKDEIINYASDNNILFNEFENVNKTQVLDELSNVIFNLNKDDVSNVVSTTLADHIIILDAIESKREPNFDDVKEEIKSTLTNVQLDNFFNDLKSQINQQILNGFSINDISRENDLEVINLYSVEKSSEETNDLENNIINYSFTQNKELVSDVVDFDTEKSFILNVNNIYPSKPLSIDEKFEDILIDFIKYKKLNFVKKIYNDNKIKSFDEVKELFDLNSDKISLTFESKNLSDKLINNIFNSELNDVVFSEDESNVYFAKINDIIIPNDIEFSNEINLVGELKNAFGNEIIKTKNISINDELINGLLSQYK